MYSCRKGEEDPLFSFRTRKARLTGEWIVSGYESKYYFGDFLFSSKTLKGSNIENLEGSVWNFSQEIVINNDGTYSSNIHEGQTINTIKGNWAFLGKSKSLDLKKKEALILDEKSSLLEEPGYGVIVNTTHSNFLSGNGVVYEIVKLSNKEIILFKKLTSEGTNISSISTDEIKITLTKKENK